MRYENYLKEDLVKECYEKDEKIKKIKKQLEELSGNEEINKDILLKDVELERQVKRLNDSLMFSEQEITNLKQQLEIYKECIEAISGNRKV